MTNSTWWDKSKTHLILKLDYAYIEKLILTYSIDNFKIEGKHVGNRFYEKPEFTCELCGKGSKKRKYRPACFVPTDIGYYYACTECEPSLSLYQFLSRRNPDIAEKYQFERWRKKLTGSCYNCPGPPKNIKKAYYQTKERESKEKNKRAYEARNS